VLVLPKRLQVCLAKDAADVTGRTKMAANPKMKRTGGKEEAVYPTDADSGRLLVATNKDQLPLYETIDAFKSSRLRMTELEAAAVGRLRLKLLEADGLPDPDQWGMVNAFAEASIVSNGQARSISSSSTHISTCPVWNEFMDFLVLDEASDVLRIAVRDRDLLNKAKSIPLGHTEVKVSDLLNRTGWREAWLPLVAPGPAAQGATSAALVHVAMEYAALDPSSGPAPPNEFKLDGPAQGSLLRDLEQEHPYSGKLIVTISKAENLVKLDWTGAGLDPYVVVDYGDQQKKTPTLSGLNPVFDKTFAFDCGNNTSSVVVLAVKDHETTRSDRVVGTVTIKLEDLMQAPGKVMSDAFALRNPQDRQMVRDADGKRSTLHLTIKHLDERAESDIGAQAAGRGLDASPASASAAVKLVSQTSTSGSLFVRVVQANDLQKMDWTGSSDPYVSLAVDGKGKDKTRYLEKNLDPEWSLAPLSVLFSRAAAIRSPDGA